MSSSRRIMALTRAWFQPRSIAVCSDDDDEGCVDGDDSRLEPWPFVDVVDRSEQQQRETRSQERNGMTACELS